jgi:hypothetical protein
MAMNTQSINIMAMTSELLSRTSIIKLPEGTTYNIQDTLNVILHAATSVTNSLESASIDLRLKNPDKNIPSADSIHDYINSNSIDYIMSAFRHINTEIIELAHLSGTTHDIAIDFHDIPYYGEKNTCGVRGIKPKNGTCWGYSFCSLDIIGETKLTLDAIDINGLTKNYAVLIESLLKRINSMGILVKTSYMDREFFNLPTISTLHNLNTQYVIAATANKKINRMLNDHKKKFGSTSTILEYQFKKGGPKFNIVAILNPNYDPNAKKDKGKGNNEYFLFATNLQVNSTSEFIKIIPEEYKKRWNIETGYKIKNVFKIRTCSKSPVVRILFFLIQCLLYNILNLLKSGLKATVYELKSAINNGILMYLREGYKSLCVIPIAAFLKKLREYNEGRIQTLQARLTQI